MLGLHALAVRVELFGDLPDARLLCLATQGEREGIEAAGLGINRIIANAEPATSSQRIGHVDAAAQDAEAEGIIQCDRDQHVIGSNAAIKELKEAVFGKAVEPFDSTAR